MKIAAAVLPQFVESPIVTPHVLHSSSGCFWSGTAPFCISKCGKSYQEVLTDKRGDGKICWTGYKKRCCPLPAGMVKVMG